MLFAATFSCACTSIVFDLFICLQGLVTLQLIRDSSLSRGYLNARSVTGFLSDVYTAAADEIGKVHLIADEKVSIQDTSQNLLSAILKVFLCVN